jgi:DNA-binding transcriptional ArsR family regulator
MDDHQHARLEARAKIIKALSHPTRLFMVEELAKGRRCVSELTEMIEADVSTVSKHLSVLANVGIVRSEKHGNQVYYQLQTPCILNFFGCVEAVMEATAEEKAALVRL